MTRRLTYFSIILLIIIFILSLKSFLFIKKKSERILLDELIKDSLTYEQLPKEVKDIYMSALDYNKGMDLSGYQSKLQFVNLDSSKVNTEYIVPERKRYWDIPSGHTIMIGSKELFILTARKGNPFVLHNKKIYYTLELNLYADFIIENAIYVSIDVKNYLDY